MPRKLKFYQKKSAERLKKLRKLIVDNYVMRNADSSPSRCHFLSLYRILYLCRYIAIFILKYGIVERHVIEDIKYRGLSQIRCYNVRG